MKTPTLLCILIVLVAVVSIRAEELVYLDDGGVIRWRADDREVALFGANYNLGSASDFRAAGRLGVDRKQLVEQDFTHFARMGWDGVRLATWGDWESSDIAGNLIVNEHIDVLDYAIYQAKKRGIFILFNPIHTYSAWWPDAPSDGDYPGFAAHYEKRVLGLDPAAIAAQVNYLHQFLEHVNPYTGVALKDEPQILFVEMINEPWHHPEDFTGSVDYINALVQAVRDTGCEKVTFHNISQTFDIIPPTLASQVQGGSFGWYPTGLNSKHALTENYLRTVDDYTPLLRPDVRDLPLIVYEFDSGDMDSGYMYPAMARAFRGVGAQFAAMFSYDMLATAPTNAGWQTHWLNLVHSPKKAVSAIIAAEVMRRIPADSRYGDYPANRTFGPFRVSYEEDSSELVTDEVFMHANDTASAPTRTDKLERIVGSGSSPIVSYEGSGAYFLDKLGAGIWRLEVYPDAEMVADPFALEWDAKQLASRLVSREWPMTVRLVELGETFQVAPLDAGNQHEATARRSTFGVKPGVYVLSRHDRVDTAALPAMIGAVGLREFVCPAAPELPAQIRPQMRTTFASGETVIVRADVISANLAREVAVIARSDDGAEHRFTLPREHRYTYAATLPAGVLGVGGWRLGFGAKVGEEIVAIAPSDPAAVRLSIVSAEAPVVLFDAKSGDVERMVYSRADWELRKRVYGHLTDNGTNGFQIAATGADADGGRDLTASLSIKERIIDRRADLGRVERLRIEMKSQGKPLPAILTLVEVDGTAWSTRIALPDGETHLDVALADLRLSPAVMLPQGYPNNWAYWMYPARGRGAPGDRVRLEDVEHLQLSLRPAGPSKSGQGSVTVTRIVLPMPE
ncbi:hypothetical protein [Synoicihabitans lomoniglobus]|uniref:Glycoside hydrolase family 5 domain-containing protein n=1 Tax=Synoicihabitans lomoniglobus TaxID=2909285 RepID=A0AAE9ZZ31_9BACT|nr:hypothetical protein [Opitutaceae bacterium LMO-M01]WED65348.1 hypothetical protein PXH66_00610 [Opitutaceae bacterium LMO-M01]